MGKKLDFVTQREKDYRRAFHGLVQILIRRLFNPWLFYDWACFLTSFRLYCKENKLIRILQSFTKDVIKKRENDLNMNEALESLETANENYCLTKNRRLAMLDLMLKEKKQRNLIDDEGIREEVDTFMFEGHDTTAAALTFLLLIMACHKDAQVCTKIYRYGAKNLAPYLSISICSRF